MSFLNPIASIIADKSLFVLVSRNGRKLVCGGYFRASRGAIQVCKLKVVNADSANLPLTFIYG